MKWPEIQNPDLHHINAATGWLELGAPDEASAEIEKLDFLVRYHPDVLIVRWKICARLRRWEQALDLARSMVKVAPDRPAGWICLSHSLYNNQRTEEALSELQVAARRFPTTSAIFYFLARLSCRLGHTTEAKMWLGRWKDMVDETAIRNTVNDDPTLAPIWKELGVSLEQDSSAERVPPPTLVPAAAEGTKRL